VNQMKSLLPASTRNNKATLQTLDVGNGLGKPHERTNAPSKRDAAYASPGKPPVYRKPSLADGSVGSHLLSPANYHSNKKLQLNQRLKGNGNELMPSTDFGNGMHSGQYTPHSRGGPVAANHNLGGISRNYA
jgi:hypothetical protein